MAHSFDEDYLRRSDYSIAMIVANCVIRDSRVLKTAGSLSKRGYRVHLFGLNNLPEKRIVEGFPFRITLVSNPMKTMPEEGLLLGAQDTIEYFGDTLASEYLAALGGKTYDLLHTHDTVGLPVGARLRESGLVGSTGWIYDIHEYVAGYTHIPEAKRLAYLSMEKQHIAEPDALTCVSPIMSRLMADRYGVAPPGVVFNTPRLADFDPFYPTPIRRALVIEEDIPLLVYSGNVKSARGLHYAVEALSLLPGVHMALVTNSRGQYLEELCKTAERLGVSSRLHLHPYVPSCDVSSFLRGATAGIVPLAVYGNTDLAFTGKCFEYLHAGLPIVSTATTAMSDFLAENNCGVTFRPEDVEGFAGAVKEALARFPQGLPTAAQGSLLAQRFCWEEQEKVIFSYYDRIISRDEVVYSLAPAADVQPILHLPKHSANQPGTLARALVKLGFEGRSAAIGRNRFGYASDTTIFRQPHSLSSAKSYFDVQGLGSYKTYHFHARSLLYNARFSFPAGLDLLLLKAMGKRVFFHFRGSEVRMHSVYRLTSPYNWAAEYWRHSRPGNAPLRIIKGMPTYFNEQDQRAFRDFVCGVCDGVFVPDSELQCYVPDALIVPRAIELHTLDSITTEDEGQGIAVVVHAPSRDIAKGTKHVVAAVEELRSAGYTFEFHLIQDIPHEEAMALYRKATIIVDSLRTGWYGVLAVEGMALGKCVVSYISSHLRHYLPYPSPLVSASPDNITGVLRHLLDNPEESAAYGKRGRAFVERYHDARAVAETLMQVYRRPVRPIDPVAAADFVAHQTDFMRDEYEEERAGARPPKKMGRRGRRGVPDGLRPVTLPLQLARVVMRADNLRQFIRLSKEEGLSIALKKSVAYVKARNRRLRLRRN